MTEAVTCLVKVVLCSNHHQSRISTSLWAYNNLNLLLCETDDRDAFASRGPMASAMFLLVIPLHVVSHALLQSRTPQSSQQHPANMPFKVSTMPWYLDATSLQFSLAHDLPRKIVLAWEPPVSVELIEVQVPLENLPRHDTYMNGFLSSYTTTSRRGHRRDQ